MQMSLQCLYDIYTMFVQCLYKVYIRFIRCLYDVCTMYIQGLYDVCTMYIQGLYDVCTMSVRCIYDVYTMYLPDVISQNMYNIPTQNPYPISPDTPAQCLLNFRASLQPFQGDRAVVDCSCHQGTFNSYFSKGVKVLHTPNSASEQDIVL